MGKIPALQIIAVASKNVLASWEEIYNLTPLRAWDEGMRARLEQAEKDAKELGRSIAKQMPQGWGFALILFSFGEDGFSTYISNVKRDDMIKALRECADKIEQGKDDL